MTTLQCNVPSSNAEAGKLLLLLLLQQLAVGLLL
jgi:hypothetical protein